MPIQVSERFPESGLEITTMTQIFDIEPFVHMKAEHVSTYGEQEIEKYLWRAGDRKEKKIVGDLTIWVT